MSRFETHIPAALIQARSLLRLGFSDGSSRDVDLTGELHGRVSEPLADPDCFAKARVDDELGTVGWPNGADLDPLVLHGDFEAASGLAQH